MTAALRYFHQTYRLFLPDYSVVLQKAGCWFSSFRLSMTLLMSSISSAKVQTYGCFRWNRILLSWASQRTVPRQWHLQQTFLGTAVWWQYLNAAVMSGGRDAIKPWQDFRIALLTEFQSVDVQRAAREQLDNLRQQGPAIVYNWRVREPVLTRSTTPILKSDWSQQS